ncbi:MAG: CvpA family protein [Ruminococcus sp.]|nr:CvpA family protein [Ruminococcus sp.]
MTSLCFDIITLLLIILPIVHGFSKGFKRLVVSLIIFIVAAMAALMLSQTFSEPIYDSFFSDMIKERCEDAVGDTDPVQTAQTLLSEYGIEVDEDTLRTTMSDTGDAVQSAEDLAEQYGLDEQSADEFSDKLNEKLESMLPQSVADSLPEGMTDLLTDDFSSGEIFDMVQAFSNSDETAAEYVEQNFAKPICVSLIELVLYFVIMILVRFILLLVFRAFGFNVNGRARSGVDRLLGAILGVVEAAIDVFIFMWLISAMEQASGGAIGISGLESVVFLPLYKKIAGS